MSYHRKSSTNRPSSSGSITTPPISPSDASYALSNAWSTGSPYFSANFCLSISLLLSYKNHLYGQGALSTPDPFSGLLPPTPGTPR